MYDNRGRGGMGGGRLPPVKVGDEIDVKIEAVGEKGDGIAKKAGFVLFVPNAKEGEEVRIRVTRVLRKVGFAEVIGQAQGPVEQSEPKKQYPKKEESERYEETSEDTSEESSEETDYDYSKDSEEF